VVTELGAVDDVIRMRSSQARLYWLMGDKDASAAAMAEAQRCADGVTWPGTLSALALVKAGLACWDGDAEAAHEQLDVARSLLGDEAEQPHMRAATHAMLGHFAEDLAAARDHLAAACQAAAETGNALVIPLVLTGVADLALRREQYEQAVRLLAAAAGVLGGPDRSNPDVARIEQAARHHLGDVAFDEAALEGTRTSWTELVEVTLA